MMITKFASKKVIKKGDEQKIKEDLDRAISQFKVS